MVDALEQQGLLLRTPHPGDRRAKLVTTIGAAQSVLETARQITGGLQQELTEHVTAEDMATCLKVLRAMSSVIAVSPSRAA